MLSYIYDLATDKKRGLIDRFFKFLLYILSLIYGLSVRVIIFLRGLRPLHLDCKVISIGNITLGGTGKTSLVEKLAADLKQKGSRFAVLSRGYKRSINGPLKIGDEPQMLSRKLKGVPIIVDQDRVRGARRAVKEYGADTVVLDDGLQQWGIAKDLEIITIDATDPFGNQRLIPRGILREPLSSLKRAQAFVLTKTNLNPDLNDLEIFLNRINPQALIVRAVHKPIGFYKITEQPQTLLGLEIFKARKVGLFCGIGDPDSFENLVLSLGIEVGFSLAFADHYNYRQTDLEEIILRSRNEGIDTLVTTEKDAVRLNKDFKFGGLGLYVLRIKLEIIENEAFLKRIYSLY